MAAVVTFDVSRNHSALSLWVVDRSHACILPRILAGGHKDDVLSLDVKASEHLVGSFSIASWNVFREDSLAEIYPV